MLKIISTFLLIITLIKDNIIKLLNNIKLSISKLKDLTNYNYNNSIYKESLKFLEKYLKLNPQLNFTEKELRNKFYKILKIITKNTKNINNSTKNSNTINNTNNTVNNNTNITSNTNANKNLDNLKYLNSLDFQNNLINENDSQLLKKYLIFFSKEILKSSPKFYLNYFKEILITLNTKKTNNNTNINTTTVNLNLEYFENLTVNIINKILFKKVFKKIDKIFFQKFFYLKFFLKNNKSITKLSNLDSNDDNINYSNLKHLEILGIELLDNKCYRLYGYNNIYSLVKDLCILYDLIIKIYDKLKSNELKFYSKKININRNLSTTNTNLYTTNISNITTENKNLKNSKYNFFCYLCNKKYINENRYKCHLNSKKHTENLLKKIK